MTKTKTFEQLLDGRLSRRLKLEDRYLGKIENRWEKAADKIGVLIREGREVYYICTTPGEFREGSRVELIQFLIRNKYV